MSTQAFEALRKDLNSRVRTFTDEQTKIEAQLSKLRADFASQEKKLLGDLEKVKTEGTTTFEALRAHEATMANLGMIDKRTLAKAAKAKAGKTMKGAKKKAAAKAQPTTKAPKKVATKKAAKKVATKKVAKKAAAKTKTGSKTGSKTVKKARGKVSKKTAVSNAAEGRRAVARGDRPPMKEAMINVMGGPGGKPMTAKAIVEGLEKKGWMPVSKDPQQYISFMLSSNKSAFERVNRGEYIVRAGATQAKAPKTRLKGKEGKKTPNGEVDQQLKDLGIGDNNVAANPFAG